MGTLADEVAKLEAENERLEAQVGELCPDPTIDYVTMELDGSNVLLKYFIKDWKWNDDAPSVSLNEIVLDEIEFITDSFEPREYLVRLAGVFSDFAARLLAASKNVEAGA